MQLSLPCSPTSHLPSTLHNHSQVEALLLEATNPTKPRRQRAKTKAALGPRYSLKAFDDLVVKSGACPLTVLGEVVDDFIKAGGKSAL